MPERIIIRNTQCPGDLAVLSAAIRDLNKAHPGRFQFMMDTSCPMIFTGNPYLIKFPEFSARKVVAKYPLIHQSNQVKKHFLLGFIEYLNQELKASAILTEFKPDIYLTEIEKKGPPLALPKGYWVFASGGKKDYTAKMWSYSNWQKVADALKGKIPLVQVGGGSHIHPRINGVIDLVGKTSVRDLMRLIYHADGVMCAITCLMHIAAGFNKPCVVIAGGREPYSWESYTLDNRLLNMRYGQPNWNPPSPDNFIPHRFLHMLDKLPCCTGKACWKSRIELDGPGSKCVRPVVQNGQRIPECMQMITPEMVLESVEWYKGQGIIK